LRRESGLIRDINTRERVDNYLNIILTLREANTTISEAKIAKVIRLNKWRLPNLMSSNTKRLVVKLRG